MTVKVHSFIVGCVFLGIMARFSTGQTANLKKNYTLVVPIMLPMTGAVSAIGPWARATIELALNTINNLSSVLPNYNLVMDIGDDQCADAPAVKRTLNFYLNYKPTRDLSTSTGTEFGTFQPVNSTFNEETAKTGYVVPLFLGGICSPSCVAAAKFPQHFDSIDMVTGMNVEDCQRLT